MPVSGSPSGYPPPSSSTSTSSTTGGHLNLRPFLKRPISPSSESSASKRAISEGASPSSRSSSEPTEQSGDPPHADGELESLQQQLRLTPTSSPSAPRSDFASQIMSQQASGAPPAVVSVAGAPPTPPPDDGAAAPAEPRPAPEQQLATIKGLADAPLRKGETWYVVSRAWYKRWQAACTGGSEGVESKEDADLANISVEDVGPVDNTPIANGFHQLKAGLQLGVDVEIVPQAAWKLLEQWYGSSVNDHEFPRTVIAPSGAGSESIEFYPPTFFAHLVLQPNELPPGNEIPTSSPRLDISIARNVEYLKTSLRFVLKVPDGAAVRLWRLPLERAEPSPIPALLHTDKLPEGAELLTASDAADLNEALLSEPQIRIGVEPPDAEGHFATVPPATAPTKGDASKPFGNQNWLDKMERQNEANFLNPRYKSTTMNGVPVTPSDPTASSSLAVQQKSDGGIIGRLRSSAGFGARPVNKVRGLTGLSNLGNTCFMNSALQCMSNCPEVKQYFISGVYRSELNPTNPLGMGGKVADAFGQLIERLWDPRSSSAVAPREFKSTIGRFASQFLGYGQQDSQELLAFLLDALHEDLNRVKQKPFDEIPDWDGGADEELMKLAETCWELYKRRNDSVIVDLFQGQYKSTLVCPDCGKVAIKFDPVLYLTLALPSTRKWKGRFWWVPLDVTKPRVPIQFEVGANASIRDVKRHIGKILNANAERMAVVEDFSGKPWKVWQDLDTVEAVRDNDIIIIYETPEPFAALARGTFTGDGHLLLPVLHSGAERPARYGSKSADLFGVSFVIALSPADARTYDGIHDAVIRQYARRIKRAEDLYDDDTPEAAPVDSSDRMDMSPRPPSSPIQDTNNGAKSSPAPPQRFRKDVFQIRVPTRPLPSRFPTSNSISGPTEPLQERRSPAASSSTSAIPGSFTPEDPDDLYGDGPNASTAVPVPEDSAAASSAPPPPPLVVPGDWLECNWSPAAQKHFFGDGDNSWADGETIVDPDIIARAQQAASGKKRSALSIEDCMRDLRTPELLGEDDMWRCPDCKDFRQATKTMQIWKAPDILVVHLKRFSSARTAYGRSSKIETFVDFPIEGLDLSEDVEGVKVARRLQRKRREETVASANEGAADAATDLSIMVEDEEIAEEADESLIYDLFAVSNHFGGLGGGHYTAFAKNEEDGLWHNYDDSHVSVVTDPEKIKSSAAYLLFYRRRTSRVLGPKTHDIVSSAIQSRSASAAPSERSTDDVTKAGADMPALSSAFPASSQPALIDTDVELDGSDDEGDMGAGGMWKRLPRRQPSPPSTPSGFGIGNSLPSGNISWGGGLIKGGAGKGSSESLSSPAASSTGAHAATPNSSSGSRSPVGEGNFKLENWSGIGNDGDDDDEGPRAPLRATKHRSSRMVIDDDELPDYSEVAGHEGEVIVPSSPEVEGPVHEVKLD